MKKLFSLFVLLFVAASFFSTVSAASYGPHTLVDPIAIDGGTIHGDVPIWPDIMVDAAIRVAGVDTPELRATTPCERTLALKAKDFTDRWLLANQPITISHTKPDKYSGRYDASVAGRDGSSLAGAMIASGLGRAYSSGVRQTWC